MEGTENPLPAWTACRVLPSPPAFHSSHFQAFLVVLPALEEEEEEKTMATGDKGPGRGEKVVGADSSEPPLIAETPHGRLSTHDIRSST